MFILVLVSTVPVPNSVETARPEEEIVVTNGVFANVAADSCSVFIILCILTFSQKQQFEIAYLRHRQKD